MKLQIFKASLVALLPSLCFAQGSIQIESDTAQYDHFEGSMTHTGHVVVHWLDRVLMADTLILHKTKDGQLSHLIAHGKPATFEGTLSEQNNKSIAGQAQVIRFDLQPNTIVLKEKAQLEYQGDKFQGPLIRFNFNNQSIVADKMDTVRPTLIFDANLGKFNQQKEQP